jgi:hypothetical protein
MPFAFSKLKRRYIVRYFLPKLAAIKSSLKGLLGIQVLLRSGSS